MREPTKAERLSCRDRRLLHPTKDTSIENVFAFPLDYSLRNKVLDWIAISTSGEFYIGANVLYFVNDNDALMYRLSDVQRRATEESL